MKNRLLEDIGDSQSGLPVPPVRRVQAAPPQPQAGLAPPHSTTPADVQEAPVRQRAGVWRSRPSVVTPAPPRTAQQPWPSVRPHVAPRMAPSPAPETPRAEPRMAPGIGSFSSPEPDWSIPLQSEAPPWTERWGRKALGWTMGLAAVVAVAGTAAWMVQETRVESTLAVVADHTPAQTSQPAPPVPASAPVSEPEMETPPPLKLLPPEPAAAAPAEAAPASAENVDAPLASAGQESAGQDAAGPADVAPAATGAAAAAATAASTKAVTPPAPKQPAAKRVPERRVAAAAPAKRTRAETTKQAPKPAREQVAARAPALPARTVPAEQPDPESPLAETLRLCRAAGYHATACLKRGCEATRFGLVCRG